MGANRKVMDIHPAKETQSLGRPGGGDLRRQVQAGSLGRVVVVSGKDGYPLDLRVLPGRGGMEGRLGKENHRARGTVVVLQMGVVGHAYRRRLGKTGFVGAGEKEGSSI